MKACRGILLWTVLSAWCLAWPTAATAVVQERTVTISQGGLALVREVDTVALPPGRHTVVLENFPRTMDLESLSVRPLTDVETVVSYDVVSHFRPITENQLLKSYVGKPLDVVITNPKGSLDARMVRRVQLVSDGGEGGSPVFLTDEGVYTGEYHGIFFPSLPEELSFGPKVFWNVENKSKAPLEVRAERLYEAGGLQWKALYGLYLNEEASQAVLDGRIVVHNTTDMEFPGVRVVLLAGDLQRVLRRDRVMRAAMAAPQQALMDKPGAVEEAAAFEYHLYRLADPVHLPAGDPLQIPWVKASAVPIEKRVVSTGNGSGADWGFERKESRNQPVRALIDIQNEVASGLGIPLPAGVIAARMITGQGEVIPLGEEAIGHTPVHGTLHLEFGRSFDVQVERTLEDIKKVGQNVQRLRWTLVVKNAKAQAQRVILEENLSGDWKILQSSQPYEKVHAGLVRFAVDAPAQGQVQLTYEVETTTR
ncbi:DUF4139 domain-containing protein [Desulfosoma sp.]|uniref:DUF4139 domain-containing protein n=1 Tax=Desulfosoma sp. TaxID=2603217 RepID=UPI004049DD5D